MRWIKSGQTFFCPLFVQHFNCGDAHDHGNKPIGEGPMEADQETGKREIPHHAPF